MATRSIQGRLIDLTDDGFFVEADQWVEEMIPDLARSEGIASLTEDQLRVIKFMRAAYVDKGAAPAVRALSKLAAVPIRELYAMFPNGPAKVAARIAGVPKPRGCI
jgi:tRNA 2-thiouridine synthesizing protein E